MTTPQDPPAIRKKRARARKKLEKWRQKQEAAKGGAEKKA